MAEKYAFATYIKEDKVFGNALDRTTFLAKSIYSGCRLMGSQIIGSIG
jgi:hypothetical protein